MHHLIAILFLLLPLLARAQFTQSKEGLTIIVTDGTEGGKDSPLNPPGNAEFTDPIHPLGMQDAIQAGAFTERPQYGKAGFLLIFCVNDSIGGKQGILMVNGQPIKGVFRLIRQKMSPDEEMPEGMTPYRLAGTIYLLGAS